MNYKHGQTGGGGGVFKQPCLCFINASVCSLSCGSIREGNWERNISLCTLEGSGSLPGRNLHHEGNRFGERAGGAIRAETLIRRARSLAGSGQSGTAGKRIFFNAVHPFFTFTFTFPSFGERFSSSQREAALKREPTVWNAVPPCPFVLSSGCLLIKSLIKHIQIPFLYLFTPFIWNCVFGLLANIA